MSAAESWQPIQASPEHITHMREIWQQANADSQLNTVSTSTTSLDPSKYRLVPARVHAP